MATVDDRQVRLAPSGDVHIGPVGTTEPTSATSTLDPAIQPLGYITVEGVSITPNVEIGSVQMWQTLSPVKRPITSVNFEIMFKMGQINKTTLGIYFLGGTWEMSGGNARMNIPSNPGTQERLLIVSWTDDVGDNYRLVVPRASMDAREAMVLVRENATTPGITLSALDSSGITGYLLSDNDDLLPAT